MASLSINESTIRSHANPQSFERGCAYHRSGHVVALVQRGNTLIGEVEGSEVEPYRVTVQLDKGGVADTQCSCPYAFEGWCKHIVATLLASLENPDQIEQRPTLDALLDPLSRDQLRVLLKSMAMEDPRLVNGIEIHLQQVLALPGSLSRQPAPRRTPVDPKPFRQQVQSIIYEAEGQWDDAPALEAISNLVSKADAFTRQGDGNNALIILEAIIETYVERWMNLDGSSGESGMLFEELDEALAEAILTAEWSAPETVDWETQLMTWQDEVAEYGIDHAFAKSELALTQGWDDPQLVAALNGKGVGSLDPAGNNDLYGGRSLTQIRLAILERQERFDEYLNLAEATGQGRAYLQMLTQLGRIDQVMDLAPQRLNTDDDALVLAQDLRSQGALDQALTIADMGLTLPGYGKGRLGVWASELAEGMGQVQRGLDARLTAFAQTPSLVDYLKIQELADPGQWPEYRKTLLKQLRKTQDIFAAEAKVDIFLHEGLLEDAMQAVDQLSSFDSELIHRVMDAAIESYPDWVMANARRRAESIMDGGKAKHYAHAVQWLRQVRDAYSQAGQLQEWQAYYAELNRNHARKRKLISLLQGLKQ